MVNLVLRLGFAKWEFVFWEFWEFWDFDFGEIMMFSFLGLWWT